MQRAHTTTCRLCGAKLAPDNRTGVCSCHPPYDPRTDPDFGDWLLACLRHSAGRPVRPLDELRTTGRRVIDDRAARDCVNAHIERLRRHGHVIRGLTGRRGGYVYLRRVKDARVSGARDGRQ